MADYKAVPEYGRRGTDVSLTPLRQNLPQFQGPHNSMQIRFINQQYNHNFVLRSQFVFPYMAQVRFDPNVQAPWEPNPGPSTVHSVEYQVLVRDGQQGETTFTWMSEQRWTFEEHSPLFFQYDDFQPPQGNDTQNQPPSGSGSQSSDNQSSDPRHNAFFVYQLAFKNGNLKSIFEKAKIKELMTSNPTLIVQLVEHFALLDLARPLEFLSVEYGVDLRCTFPHGDNILDIGLKYGYEEIVELATKYFLKTKQGLSPQTLDSTKFKFLQKYNESKHLEAYFISPLGRSFTPIETWENFLKNLLEKSFNLSLEGAIEILNVIGTNLSDLVLIQKTQSFLSGFTKILGASPNMSVILEKRGPFYLKSLIQFHSILSINDYLEDAIELIRALIEIVPGFNDWKLLVSNPSDFEDKITKELENITPATNLPTSETLELRKEKKMVGKIMKQTKNDITEANSLTVNDCIQEVLVFERLANLKQQEILDDVEKLALNSYQKATEELNDLIKNKQNEESIDSKIEEQSNIFDQIIEIQERRRAQQKERFDEKCKELKKTVSESEEKQRNEAIKYLQEQYKMLQKYSKSLHVMNEICYIDNQITIVHEAAINLVLVGLSRSGKTSVLNSFIGAEISQIDSPTSIPIRFKHTLTKRQPELVLPFANQLNIVLKEAKKFIQDYTSQVKSDSESDDNKLDERTVIKELITNQRLIRIVDLILEGFQFEKKYVGKESVFDALANINGIYRLVTEKTFSDRLLEVLPFDWNRGLDTYATIFYEFPELKGSTNVFDFSIIDTPGIDDSSIQCLNPLETIKTVISYSNYLGLVFKASDVDANGLIPLKNPIFNAKKKWGLPGFALVTNSDGIAKDDHSNKKEDISNSIKSSTGSKIFTTDEVFLIDAKKKVLCSEMSNFISEFKRKPSFDSENKHESDLASNWSINFSFGYDEEEKTQYFNNLSLDKLTPRCQTLIKESKMKDPLDHIEVATTKGIYMISETSKKKVQEIMKNIQERINHRRHEDELKNAERILNDIIQRIKTSQTDLERRAQIKAADFNKIISQLYNNIKDDATSFESDGFSRTDSQFFSNLKEQLKEIQEPKFEKLKNMLDAKTLTFKNKSQYMESLTYIKEIIEAIILDQFRQKVKDFPQMFRETILEQLQGILKLYQRAESDYSENMNIILDSNIKEGMVEYRDRSLEELNIRIDHSNQGLLKRRNKPFTIRRIMKQILHQTTTIDVSASELRQIITSYTLEISTLYYKCLETRIEQMVTEAIDSFVVLPLREFQKLKLVVDQRYTESVLSSRNDM